MTFQSLLIHRVKIHRFAPAGVPDRYGNRPEAQVSVSDAIPARLEEPDASENLDDRDLQRKTYLLFLPVVDEDGDPIGIDGSSEVEWLDYGVTLKLDGAPSIVSDGIGAHHLEGFAYRTTG